MTVVSQVSLSGVNRVGVYRHPYHHGVCKLGPRLTATFRFPSREALPAAVTFLYPNGEPLVTDRLVPFVYLRPFAAAWLWLRPAKRRVFTAGISGITIRALALGLARELHELHQKLSRSELFHPGAHEQTGLYCECGLRFAFAPRSPR